MAKKSLRKLRANLRNEFEMIIFKSSSVIENGSPREREMVSILREVLQAADKKSPGTVKMRKGEENAA